jgi:hypothetical protein
VENSKRVQRALKKLDELKEALDFYSNSEREYRVAFKEIRELIDELAIDRKVDHTRLAKKLKAHWKAEDS